MSGHVTIGDRVIVGGMCGVHQFVRLGDLSFLGAGSMASKDVPPYCMAQGDRAGAAGLNIIGLQRNGFSEEDIKGLKKLYRQIFFGPGKMSERVYKLKAEVSNFQAGQEFLNFLSESDRGIVSTRRKSVEEALPD